MTPEIIEQPCLVLVGPTAIGKTDFSLTLARQYGCEIISVDSMQVYRHMDIGTAKASPDERAEIPHHLIDIVDPDENYDAARFAVDALHAIRDIHSRGKIPLLTGGTGLYLRALFEGIFPGVPVDEETRRILKKRLLTEGSSKLHEELCMCDSLSAKRIHANDTQRLLRALEVFYVSGVPLSEHIVTHKNQAEGVHFTNALQIGLTTDRKILYQRINRRCDAMLESGLEDEVRKLLAMGYDKELKAFGSIGYRHILNYIDGHWTKDEAVRLLARDTRRYAKRQYTWFSKLNALQWFDVDEKKKNLRTVASWFAQLPKK
ncbi:MAG: tRNA (adenosine(37)-N6)-dimethylallyltransferase MiaA [Desulfobulbaceae bacterium]|nr:tRNA (adenosine(37)-N6)-dimethylallyltransferase MiaA [Desulfobulbaceae bacterium]